MGLPLASSSTNLSRYRISLIVGFSAVLLATLMLFGLDALQTRSVLRLEARSGFDLATGFAMMKYVWAGVALLVLSIGGWRASRRLNRDPIAQTPLMQQAPRRETVQT